MGLAASQSRLLFLTGRKAACELNITLDANRKMQLTKEMTQLSQEYSRRLSQKNIAYYANGQYNKVNYNYLMGYGANYFPTFDGSRPLKNNNSMILADYNGRVVLSDSYANAIISVLGTSAMDGYGRGGTFSEDQIPNIMAALFPAYSADELSDGILHHEWSASTVNALSGETTGSTTVDTADTYNSRLQSIIDFYYPIFQAAAANGWTTEYNDEIADSDYVSDMITSGVFQLTQIDDTGNYMPDTSLTYFVTTGDLQLSNDSDAREELTAWYNAEKARISEDEEYIDINLQNLSTELEAINTQIQAIKTFIQDATQIFNWCGNG